MRSIATQSRLLRLLLVPLTLGLPLAALMAWGIGADLASMDPSLAHLHIPVFIGIVIGALPVLAGIVTTWRLAGLATTDRAFTSVTVAMLRRLRLLVAVTVGYYFLGFALAWILAGSMHPGVALLFLGLELVGLLTLTLTWLLELLFTRATEYRTDSELTV